MTTKTTVKDFTVPSGFGTKLGMYYSKTQAGENQLDKFVYKPRLVRVHYWKNGIYHSYNTTKLMKLKNSFQEPHDYEMSQTSYLNNQFQMFSYWTGTTVTKDSQSYPWVYDNPVTFWTPYEEQKLLSKLQSEIQGSDFNLGVTLGEGVESLEMIANSATRLYNALRHLKRGDFRAVAKVLGVKEGRPNDRNAGFTLSQGWLEYRLGWEPLVSDVFEASKFVAQQLNDPLTKSYRVRRSITRTFKSPPNPQSTYGQCVVSYKKQIIARIKKKPSLGTLSGITAPSSVAWELVPLSFVVDWFIPIGDWLSSQAFFSGLEAEYVTTVQTSVHCNGILSGKIGTPYRFVITGGEGVVYDHHTLKRVVTDTITSGNFPKVRSLKDVPSMKRALTALALLNNKNFKFP